MYRKSVAANPVESGKTPGLTLPITYGNVPFTRWQRRAAANSYTQNIDDVLKTLAKLNRTLNARVLRHTFPVILGAFQNPSLTRDELSSVWALCGSMADFEDMLDTKICWNVNALSVLVEAFEEEYRINGTSMDSGYAVAVGAYTGWSAENCHLFAKVTHHSAWEAFRRNTTVDDDIRVMVSLLSLGQPGQAVAVPSLTFSGRQR